MQQSDNYKPNQSFSLLIQGPPGCGKTTLALKFPRPYVCDLDNNMSGTIRASRVKGQPIDCGYDVPDLIMDDKGTITGERPLKDRYKFMCDCLKAAAADPTIETIIVDGVSKLNAYIIAEIGRQNPTVGNRARAEGEMTLQDWGAHLYLWQNFITKMQATSKMFVLTAHEETSDRADLSGILVSVQGKKVQATLAGMFSDVWRCEVKDTLGAKGREYQWLVRTMQTSSLQLKNSLNLPDSFVMDWNTINTALQKGA